jgi:effector-associated domain 1 (EAD1)-containing protein/caspase domain-containing protein
MPTPARVAAVIGINYTAFPAGVAAEAQNRAGLAALRYAEADATALAAALQGAGYAVETLLGAAATRPAILDLLRRQARAAGSGGLLLVYFAGHGQVDPDDAGTAYLLPVDADPNDPADRGIPLDDLALRRLGSPAAALVWLDCCHSGYAVGLRGGAVAAGREFGRLAQTSFAQTAGRVVFTACAGDEPARELARLGHGAFTYYILDWWRDSAQVDEWSLASHVAAGLQREQLPAPVRGGVQQGPLVLRDAGPGAAPTPDAATPDSAAGNGPAPVAPGPPPGPWHYFDLIRRHFHEARDVDALAFTLGINPHTELQGHDFGSKLEDLVLTALRTNRGPALEAAVGTLRARRRQEAGDPAPPSAPAVTLTRVTRKELHQALVAAFPTYASLALMAQVELGENLAAITGATSTTQAAFELIGWAEARGHVRDLVESALAANPTNGALRDLAASLQVPPPGA